MKGTRNVTAAQTASGEAAQSACIGFFLFSVTRFSVAFFLSHGAFNLKNHFLSQTFLTHSDAYNPAVALSTLFLISQA